MKKSVQVLYVKQCGSKSGQLSLTSLWPVQSKAAFRVKHKPALTKAHATESSGYLQSFCFLFISCQSLPVLFKCYLLLSVLIFKLQETWVSLHRANYLAVDLVRSFLDGNQRGICVLLFRTHVVLRECETSPCNRKSQWLWRSPGKWEIQGSACFPRFKLGS